MNFLKKSLLALCIISLIAFYAAGCAAKEDGKDQENQIEEELPENPEDQPEYILAFPVGEYFLLEGEQKELSLTFTADGTPADVNLLQITSTDQDVVRVQNGILTAVSAGQAVIVATYQDCSAKADVLVVAEATAEQVNSFDEKYINIYGRSYVTGGKLNLDHTANAVEVAIVGKELSVKISSTASSYLQVYVDGSVTEERLNILSGSENYSVVRGLEQGLHKIRLVKATEMQDACWDILSFEAEQFACVPEKSDLKIEFIGDSISTGYGVLATSGESWSVDNSDCSKSYAYTTAERLEADYSIVAWSGICTKAYHWASITMADLYKRISYTNTDAYAFNFSPDVVVINLGTNEASYLSKNASYADIFPDDYKDFLSYVREKNPNAYIICLYGMMGKNAVIDSGISSACEKMNDEKVVYNPIPIKANNSAANGHPSYVAQMQWGEQLAEYIQNIIS